jgi:hypothetical protein
VVIGDLMKEELLTIKPQDVEKVNKRIVCLFVLCGGATSSPLEQFTSIIIVTHSAPHSSPKSNEE